ncbi:DUF4185 domain-containing protein [bacterium]|nr:DUF4185 domain-containing protein [bacterium]
MDRMIYIFIFVFVFSLHSDSQHSITQSSLSPRISTESPYPPSEIIEDVRFDFSTHIRMATGSDNWPMTWADDNRQYTAWGDGGGFKGSNSRGRVKLGVARVEGPRDDYHCKNIWGGHQAEFPAQFEGKSYGILSVHGTLYMWVAPQPNPHLAESRLAFSTDRGKHWTQADWAFHFNDHVSIPTFLNFGQDYEKARDNYVYSYFIHPMYGPSIPKGTKYGFDVHKPGKIYLSRVPIRHILTKEKYEFFCGYDENDHPDWTSVIENKHPVFDDENGVGWNVSASYNAGLKRYILCTEHTKTQAGKLGIFDAPEPWGPWTTVAYEEGWGEGNIEVSTFYWNFPNKWLGADGLNFTMVFTGKNSNDSWNTVNGRFILHKTFERQ